MERNFWSQSASGYSVGQNKFFSKSIFFEEKTVNMPRKPLVYSALGEERQRKQRTLASKALVEHSRGESTALLHDLVTKSKIGVTVKKVLVN